MNSVASLHVPAAAALLDAWECAQASDAGLRALRVLEVMCDDGGDELANRTPGQLNRLLIEARTLLFGETCDTIADCPACGAALEASIPLTALPSGEACESATGELQLGKLRVSYRLPTWRELTALADQPVDEAAADLLDECITSISSGTRQVALRDVDASTRQAIDEAICRADVDALIEVELGCPDCGATPSLPMDPASFLWDELNRWALSTLGEVVELAGTFGWSQEAILSMTPWRRRAYLSLAAPVGRST